MITSPKTPPRALYPAGTWTLPDSAESRAQSEKVALALDNGLRRVSGQTQSERDSAGGGNDIRYRVPPPKRTRDTYNLLALPSAQIARVASSTGADRQVGCSVTESTGLEALGTSADRLAVVKRNSTDGRV